MAVSTYKGMDLLTKIDPQGLKAFARQTWLVVNNILLGKINAAIEVTLTANSATTVVLEPRLSGMSSLFFGYLTANGAAAPVTYYDTQDSGTVTLHHANNANTDRTVRMLIIG